MLPSFGHGRPHGGAGRPRFEPEVQRAILAAWDRAPPWRAAGSPSKGKSMHDLEPSMLRRLASRYRDRARSEPDKAQLFEQIANDMEADARRIEDRA